MKRSLGQNFLINKNVAIREVGYSNITKDDVVLEIGPSKGILTRHIADKSKEVIAVEIDENIVRNLKSKLPDNVKLIRQDASS